MAAFFIPHIPRLAIYLEPWGQQILLVDAENFDAADNTQAVGEIVSPVLEDLGQDYLIHLDLKIDRTVLFFCTSNSHCES